MKLTRKQMPSSFCRNLYQFIRIDFPYAHRNTFLHRLITCNQKVVNLVSRQKFFHFSYKVRVDGHGKEEEIEGSRKKMMVNGQLMMED